MEATKTFEGRLWDTSDELGGFHIQDDAHCWRDLRVDTSLPFWIEEQVENFVDIGTRCRVTVTVKVERLKDVAQVLSDDALVERLQEIGREYCLDKEAVQASIESLLLRQLCALGFPRAAEEYNKIEKRYT